MLDSINRRAIPRMCETIDTPRMTQMDRFEQAFGEVADAASSALDSARKLLVLLRQLQKSAREGNIAALKRVQARLLAASAELTQEAANAAGSWAFDDEQEVRYLSDGYAGELRRVAEAKGLDIHERDGHLISHPSTVRILASDRAVRIDRKKVSTIRPSHLVEILRANQNRPARFRPEQFLSALHDVYSALAPEQPRGTTALASGPVIPLDRIYQLFTSLPGSRRDYTRTDFARDIYRLDTSGHTMTRFGARVSFPVSTGARSPRSLFTFVGPDGREVKYYGIRFAKQAA